MGQRLYGPRCEPWAVGGFWDETPGGVLAVSRSVARSVARSALSVARTAMDGWRWGCILGGWSGRCGGGGEKCWGCTPRHRAGEGSGTSGGDIFPVRCSVMLSVMLRMVKFRSNCFHIVNFSHIFIMFGGYAFQRTPITIFSVSCLFKPKTYITFIQDLYINRVIPYIRLWGGTKVRFAIFKRQNTHQPPHHKKLASNDEV